jgi:hypothetical protein
LTQAVDRHPFFLGLSDETLSPPNKSTKRRTERNLYDLLEILIRAKYTRQRQELLEQANLVLEILRFQMRLAKD